MKRFASLLVGILALTLASRGWTQVIVDDDFESYVNDAAFETSWRPMDGDGAFPVGGPIGILIPRAPGDPIQPPPPFDGSGDASVTPAVGTLVGQAVAFSSGGNINEWDDDNDISTDPFQLQPDADNNVRYTVDLFDFVNGNRRFTAGLRHDDDTDPDLFGTQQANFIELGFWNDNVTDPTDGVTEIPDSSVHGLTVPGYAYRVLFFANPGAPLIQNPGWQFFELPMEFDDPALDHNGDGRVGNGDGIVNAVDVGPGWHRFSAEVTESSVTVELDLFRDGSIDAAQTWDVELATSEISDEVAYFNSLRLGGPSGVTANEFTLVDNVRLEVVPSATAPVCDLDADGDCDLDDVDILYAASPTSADINDWLVEASNASNPALPANAMLTLGDVDLNGTVDSTDLGILLNSFGSTTGVSWRGGDLNADSDVDSTDLGLLLNNFAFGVSVPEPNAFSLLGLLGIALTPLGFARSRRESRKVA